jgi:putative resolvase
VERLELYCAAKGWSYEVIQDLGSGTNYRKKGLKQLLEKILNCQVKRVVLTHKDRLLRIGGELVFALCEGRNVEVVIINQGEEPSFEEKLVQDPPSLKLRRGPAEARRAEADVLEIITVFSARMYGARSHKNRKLVEAAKVLSEP